MKYTTIEVLVNGKPVKHYYHQGRTYIEAKTGTQYELRVRNNTARRILAVISVDGLNVITGERATPEDTGYIVGAYASATIKGFRHSDNNVAAFKFVTKSDSYNAEMGEDTSNVGVIGLVTHAERITTPIPIQHTYSHRVVRKNLWEPATPVWCGTDQYANYCADFGGHDSQASIMSCIHTSDTPKGPHRLTQNNITAVPATTVNHSVGTGWGDNIVQKTETVSFERGIQLDTELIYYSSREDLSAAGIIQPANVVQIPSAFATTYAKAPPGWRQAA